MAVAPRRTVVVSPTNSTRIVTPIRIAHSVSSDEAFLERAETELAELRQRGRLANACIALLTLCAILIGVTILVLFVGETTTVRLGATAITSFLSGVLCFLLALLCFLAETFMATRLLNFRVRRSPG